jgi:hypothetical protein
VFQGQIPGYAVHSVLREYIADEVTGQILCGVESGIVKTINLWRGRVTSASSLLIDDRLGEVIYRDGRLTLDAFVDAAGKVTKNLRFGDLLTKSGIFSPMDLYDCLGNQSKAILASLVFYSDVRIEFVPNKTVPKIELPITECLDELMLNALDELRFLRVFEQRARKSPELVLNVSALHLADNDFHRDVVQLIRETPDFNAVVDKTSRLSSRYTVRALFELYRRGVISDTWGFAQSFLSDETSTGLCQVVDEANFLFAELANAAQVEEIQDWDNIVFSAGSVLSREFGMGYYMSSKAFVHTNILRSAVLRNTVRETAMTRFEASWPGTFVEYVRDALHHGLVFILFELFNRKFSSQEFARVRVLMEDIRNGKPV